MKPVLHLNLIRKWFDIIGDPKMEEYRVCSSWNRTFRNGSIKIKGKFYHPSDVIVCFSNGYAKNRPQKKFEIKRVSVGTGREEWGAVSGEQYFVIRIGKRMDF